MKHKNIDFNKTKKKKPVTLLIIMICIAVILLGGFSFVVLLSQNDFDIQKFFGTRAIDSNEEYQSTENPSNTDYSVDLSELENINFLFICYDADRNVTFCVLSSLSPQQNTVKVKPYAVDLLLEYNSASYTLNQLFQVFSSGAVCDALQKKDVKIDRYVAVDETNFKMIMQKLGAVNVLLENDISFNVDAITYSYNAGEHSLTSDALLKLMKYAGKGDDLLKIQGDAFASVIRDHFTAENINKGETFFASLINLTQSNISAFDYIDNKALLCAFINCNPSVTVIC